MSGRMFESKVNNLVNKYTLKVDNGNIKDKIALDVIFYLYY